VTHDLSASFDHRLTGRKLQYVGHSMVKPKEKGTPVSFLFLQSH
jgi:hypothetical protein